MSSGHYPISLATQLATTTELIPPGYYRSKLFIAPYSVNTLVSAAGPMLSLLERLCLSPSLPPVGHIRDNIEHELCAFYSKLKASRYGDEAINIAHYLLSATIDELIGKNYLRVYEKASEFKSFTPLTQNNKPPEQFFFEILRYIQERPNQFLDLIELAYFCLIAGFEGEQHLKADGRQTLDNTIESLYQIIQNYRVNQPYRLFNDQPTPKLVTNNYKSTLITSLLILGIMAVAFLTSHIILENKAKNVLLGHTQLALLDD